MCSELDIQGPFIKKKKYYREISAYRLDSVALFRAEVLKKASQFIFKQQQREATKTASQIKKVKGQETYPQPYRIDKKNRRKAARFKTQPITVEELSKLSDVGDVNQETAVVDSRKIAQAFEEKAFYKPVSHESVNQEIVETELPKVGVLHHIKSELQKTKYMAEASEVVKQEKIESELPKAGALLQMRHELTKSQILTVDAATEAFKVEQIEAELPKAGALKKMRSELTKSQTLTISAGPESVKVEKIEAELPKAGALMQMRAELKKAQTIDVEPVKQEKIETELPKSGALQQMKGQLTQSQVPDANQTIGYVPAADKVMMVHAKQLPRPLSSDEDFDNLVLENARRLTKKQEEDLQHFTMSMDVPEDDLSKLSIAEKMSLFKKMEEEKKAAKAAETKPQTPKPNRRFMDRKKRVERSQTQPITGEEVVLAAEFAKEQKQQQEQEKQEQEKPKEQQEQAADEATDDATAEDELSK